MKRPNFFILGAPKCGTTALAHWLAHHPKVFMPRIKEPHFFNTDMKNRSVPISSDYERLFDGAGPQHIAIGEASTWYLVSQKAVPGILDWNANARFIVMTRDPIEMARSLHHHNLRVLNEDEPDFPRAWELQFERCQGKAIPASCVEPAVLQYRQACSLGEQLTRLLLLADPAKVLHLTLEGMQEDPRAGYLKALDFLGLEDDGRTDFSVLNQARGHRSRILQRLIRIAGRWRSKMGLRKGFGLARLNETARPKAPLAEDVRIRLLGEFEADRILFQKALTVLTAAAEARNAAQ
ncbi:sulfotransferase domain-containing protein [Parvibaculum sp.]|uniref:sulfotransferase domain-containing protein n=1 Tax=Parvibaculum sp. TaxID=2024848 RepID=UPI003919A136